jgi:hypothetical protein
MSSKQRLSASVDAELVAQALDDFLAAYEAEHGEITDEDMRDAARRARGRAVVVRGRPDERRPGLARPGRGA